MKRISIKALARIEGHAGITVTIDGKNVKNVEVQITEGPRLVEELVVGKPPEDVLNIVPRICGICSFSHRYAALRGLEKALGIEVPLRTKLARDLVLLAEIIQSHSLHIYFLSLPDFLGHSSALEMVNDHDQEMKSGLAVKAFGYWVMETMGARMIHGENPILGGFGAHPSQRALMGIKEKAQDLIPEADKTVELFASLEYPAYSDRETTHIALNPPDGEYGFVGDSILDSAGGERRVEEYVKLIEERTVPHSFAKRSRYDGKPFTVGAIARMALLGDRLKGRAARHYKKLWSTRCSKNPFFNNLAQAIEILYCIETIPELVEKIVGLEEPAVKKPSSNSGTGTGALEAPRGTLCHSYSVKSGSITGCDIVTPTAQNLDDIEEYLKTACQNLLSKGANQNLELKLEMVARAFDPCISCSAHLVRVKDCGSGI